MDIRVLIFDDDESIRNLLKTIVKKRGYEIFDYNNPSLCAIGINDKCDCGINSKCADIIITDINMPIINGVDFIKSLKEKGCKVKNIIVISTVDNVKELKLFLGEHIRFLNKPFSIHELTSILDEFEQNINIERELLCELNTKKIV